MAIPLMRTSPWIEVRNSKIHGKGVFAAKRIPKGTRIIEYIGERISHKEADDRYADHDPNDNHTFLFIVDRKTVHFDDAMVSIEDGEYARVNDRLVVEPELPVGDPKRMGGRDFNHYFRTQLREFVAAVRGTSHRSVLHEEGVQLTRLLRRAIDSSLRNAPQID